VLVIENAARLGPALATGLFRLGFAAFGAAATADFAVHLSLVDAAEAPIHLALVVSMSVVALGLVVRGSLPSPAKG